MVFCSRFPEVTLREGKQTNFSSCCKSRPAIVVNAIYFKGQWQVEFKKENTKPDVFRLAGGAQREVPMMSRSGTFFYHKGEDFQSVMLPYGTGRVSMYVFLPDEQKGLDQFEKDLTPKNWDSWMTTSLRLSTRAGAK
ncbi:MAG TPA: serpin family protein [Pyrinomonadaceae bacterium]